MRNTSTLQRSWPLAAYALVLWTCLLAGCASPVKVKENWSWKTTASGTIDLADAERTWNALNAGTPVPRDRVEAYNEAVRDSVVQIARNWQEDKQSLATLSTTRGPLPLEVDARDVRRADLTDQLIPADFIRIRRGLSDEAVVEGVGSAMVMRRVWTEDDPLVPKSGLWSPATALLDLEQPQRPVLRLLRPDHTGQVSLSGKHYPLSANYSAFLASDFQDRQRQFLGVPGMLHYAKFEDAMGLYRISSFEPGKEVCVLVHGINSSPATWRKTLNHLWADEAIRERYEFWLYGYPTGAPIPYSVMKFRDSFREMLEFREKNGATKREVTLVGHSMGGLLSKALTQRSGRENWDQLFTVPPEALKLPPEQREVLTRMILFEPVPEVKKVVFVAVPHRGSKLAQGPVMNLVSGLVEVPRQLLVLSAAITSGGDTGGLQEILTPVGQQVAKEMPTSIDQLRTNSMLSRMFSEMPLNPDVRYYSIIGNKSPESKPLEKTTDSVVPYSSSHIDGVVSETVVRSDHGVQKTEEGNRAIARILREP